MNRFLGLSTARTIAIAEAVLATLIWSSSFVFVKMILPDIGPLLIAGLRYFLAFVILLPFILRQKGSIGRIEPKIWARLTLIGISAYSIGNGALFWALRYLHATTASFILSLLPLLILFAGTIILKEFPTRWQTVGVFVSLIGGMLFFSPGFQYEEPLGIAIMMVGLIGFTAFGILGRSVARARLISTLNLTGIPLAIGGSLLLMTGLVVEGRPTIDQNAWIIIAWLAIVNTAFAYFLYNHALKSITALEMNVTLNLSPLGTAILAWLILGESLSSIQILGIFVVIVGVTIVQITGNRRKLNLHAA
jgi:drug/metabolite transporter (DMT)-like permease